MQINKIFLSNFRNLAEQEIPFYQNVNYIYGKNAQGKTNLIESIFLLANSKSFKTNKIVDYINWEEEEANLAIDISNSITNHTLSLNIKKRKKNFLLNNKQITSIIDYLGKLIVVCFTPDDLSLIKGEPQIRRKFIDRHCVDLNPSFMKTLVDYSRAIKSKNIILKSEGASKEMLFAWNKVLAKLIFDIINKREVFLKKLSIKLNETHQEFAKVDGHISLKIISNLSENHQDLSIEDINLKLNSEVDRELKAKRSILGTHRDELKIFYSNKDAKFFASQGQSRSLALSLKFAVVSLIEETINDSPVILLDDLDSELDSERVSSLFNFLYKKQRQIFITGTSIRDSLKYEMPSESGVFYIEQGKIIQEK